MQYQVRTGPIVNDAAAFSPEMVQGSLPSRGRPFTAPRLPQPPLISDVTIFSNEMSAGYQPERPRIQLGPRIPLPLFDPTLPVPVTSEMFKGYQPEKPRLTKGRVNDTSALIENALVFFTFGTNESNLGAKGVPRRGQRSGFCFMALGVDPSIVQQPDWGTHPNRPRLPKSQQIGQPTNAAVVPVAVFSNEMVYGNQPSKNRAWIAPRIPLPVFVQPVALFSQEMVYGVTVPKPRLFLGPRIPLPISQTTQVNAPFSIDMAQGNVPAKPRITRGPRLEQPPFFQVPFSIGPDELQGVTVPRPRIMLGPRIGLPLSQTHHVDAPISNEMFRGQIPSRPRLFTGPKTGWMASDAVPPPTNSVLVLGSLSRYKVPHEDRSYRIRKESRTYKIPKPEGR